MKSRITCAEAELDIVRGGNLSHNARLHLEDCASCRSFAAEIASVEAALRTAGAETPPAIDIAYRVMARIPDRRPTPLFGPRWALGTLAAAAAVALLFVSRSPQTTLEQPSLSPSTGSAESLASAEAPAPQPERVGAPVRTNPSVVKQVKPPAKSRARFASAKITAPPRPANAGEKSHVSVAAEFRPADDIATVARDSDEMLLAMSVGHPSLRLQPPTSPEVEIEAAGSFIGP